MSAEFRNVHEAREALEIYKKSGCDLQVIRSIPLDKIKRYDVWQCVFEKELLALRELQIKDLMSQLMQNHYFAPEMQGCRATLAIILITQHVEWKSPLSCEDAIKTALDCAGDGFLSHMINAAEESVERRERINAGHGLTDSQWVGYSRTVLKTLKELIHE